MYTSLRWGDRDRPLRGAGGKGAFLVAVKLILLTDISKFVADVSKFKELSDAFKLDMDWPRLDADMASKLSPANMDWALAANSISFRSASLVGVEARPLPGLRRLKDPVGGMKA